MVKSIRVGACLPSKIDELASSPPYLWLYIDYNSFLTFFITLLFSMVSIKNISRVIRVFYFGWAECCTGNPTLCFSRNAMLARCKQAKVGILMLCLLSCLVTKQSSSIWWECWQVDKLTGCARDRHLGSRSYRLARPGVWDRSRESIVALS